MTWIAKASTEGVEREKWRVQANRSAAHMKGIAWCGQQETYVAGFAFDDGFVQLRLEIALIQRLNEQALAEWIFDAVLAKFSTDHRAAGESADAQAPGMECGHAAPQAPDRNLETPLRPSGTGQPAAPAVSEPCMRRREPDFIEHCPNQAAGGLRITLKPGETVEKRWGLHSLLTFVMDLTVCAECLPKVKIMEITDQDFRAKVGKVAQKSNNGVLVDWRRTVIEQAPYSDPHYLALRAELKQKAAANESQPAPAGADGGKQ